MQNSVCTFIDVSKLSIHVLTLFGIAQYVSLVLC